ncbi:hypothetical protein PNEG_01925 [Pneumocystis murina B123]|uniref:General transcription and DNA repair factor IIH n=1 Tax=Pneumocystis murina (strain B123) TaxID=1069680 RepID=M7P7A1_PNEMU|nr:hypothetical protein PNEG_01925 [Pneumocystis murina B123]EMR09740.1 hypothetical protein PNEG_01925 [Pneumocystis murina B123]
MICLHQMFLFLRRKEAKKIHKKEKRARKNRRSLLLKSTSAGEYSWEKTYHRSWDVVQEDQQGSLTTTLIQMTQEGKRKRILRDTVPLQRGIIRYLVLVLDLSSAMAKRDMIPTRYLVEIDHASAFVLEYFEQNPLAQLSILGMREGRAVLISYQGGSPHEHLIALKRLKQMDPSGDVSLQNALEMSRTLLYSAPKHGTKEVLLIFGSLMSLDPGDIHETIDALIKDKIRVYMVGLSASVSICQKICKETNAGDESSYGIVLNEQHFKDLLMQFVIPPALQKSYESSGTLVMMGFPSKLVEKETLCSCHSNVIKEGYLCPRCYSNVCSLPINCPNCDLTLIMSTHLARSYHHLFPLKNWVEVPWEEAVSTHCYACLMPFPEKPKELTSDLFYNTINHSKEKNRIDSFSVMHNSVSISFRYACSDCHKHFCIDCDVFAHEILFECIGCQTTLKYKENKGASALALLEKK